MVVLTQLIASFLVATLVGAAALWIGMKITARFVGMQPGAVYCSFGQLMMVSAAASVAGLLPYVGWILAWVVLFFALWKVTSAPAWELILMVLFSRVAVLLTMMALGAFGLW